MCESSGGPGTRPGLAGLSAMLPADKILSQYPFPYEEAVSLPDVGDFKIRAIRPTDVSLLKELFAALSPRSVYMRFFSPLRQLSDEMLARLTQIDYDKQIALVAVQTQDAQERMLAVARVIETIDSQNAEFAVLVKDALQGKGIGASLLLRSLGIARLRGIKSVCGLVLAENTQMLALGRKLDFKVKRIPQSTEYELTITL